MLSPPPRAVKWKPGAIGGQILMGLLILGAFVIAPYLLSIYTARLETLMHSGKVTQGKVVDASVTHGKSNTYHLTLRFPQGDPRPDVTRDVPLEIYDRNPAQSTIPIVAMPNNPSDFEIGDVEQTRIDEFRQPIIFATALVGIILGVLEICLILAIRRERGLLTSGELINARVTSVRYVSGRSSFTIVQYAYQTQLGERNGKVTTPGKKVAVFPEGSEILILYNRSADKVSQPLPLFQYFELQIS